MLVFDQGAGLAHVPRMDYAALLARILLARQETQAKLAKRLEVTQPTISRWLAGKMRPTDDPERIVAEARELGILESEYPSASVPIIGYVGAGSHTRLYGGEEAHLGEAELPPDMRSKDTVALVVRGDSMWPVAEEGSLVYYNDRREPPTEDLEGRLCVVGLPDGSVVVKRLYGGRSPGKWDLIAANGNPMRDVQVSWAAKVIWTKHP